MRGFSKKDRKSEESTWKGAIKKGNRGEAVSDVQRRLRKLGYSLGPTGVDGVFKEATEQAVKNFQKDHELKVDGVVGKETWRKLVEVTYTLGDRVLYLRSPFFRGDDVRTLQKWLSTLGFSPGPIDGVFGPATERAVREFQKNMGLSSDGIVGSSTLEAFYRLRRVLQENKKVKHPREERIESPSVSIFEDKKFVLFSFYPSVKKKCNRSEIAKDVVLRLKNLVELLGGEASYINLESQGILLAEGIFAEESCLGLGFLLERAKAQEEEKVEVVCYKGKGYDDKAKSLAEFVKEEFAAFFGFSNAKILVKDDKRFSLTNFPLVVVKFFYCDRREKELLLEESFRQKMAVAIFDGIKKFLES